MRNPLRALRRASADMVTVVALTVPVLWASGWNLVRPARPCPPPRHEPEADHVTGQRIQDG